MMQTVPCNSAPAATPVSTFEPGKGGFWALIVTQFQVAFSDNALRFLVTFMGLGLGLWTGERESFVPLVGALFSAPFILFSMAGGYLADRYSKRSTTIGIKLFELGVMSLALFGLATKNLGLLLTCLCLMGTHSAIFGPSKYGLLPELLQEHELSWGNGILEMGTFLSIILGSGAGAFLYEKFGARQEFSGLLLIALTIAGLAASFAITRVPAAAPDKKFRANFIGEIIRQCRYMYQDRVLWLAMLGNVYFSFLGMLVQQNMVLYGTDVLRVSEIHVFYLMAALAVGIGLGSFAAGYLSRGKIEYGLIPLGCFGMVCFSAAIAFERPTMTVGLIDLACMGFSGGFFIVPISAILQHRPERGNKGSVLATSNLLSFVGIFAASGLYYVLAAKMHLSPQWIFLSGAITTAVATIYIWLLLPDSLLRLILWMLTSTVYRVRVVGREQIPEKGGALFVSNRLSLLDAALLVASIDRPVRFLMEEKWSGLFARILRVIPMTSTQGPRRLIHSLRAASEAIRAGEVVCIFEPETGTGKPQPFRRGFRRILKGLDVPLIPVHLDNVWGDVVSFEGGKFHGRWPGRLPCRVTVSFGRPMPSSATAFEVRQAVQELGADAYAFHRQWLLPLHHSLVRTARRHPRNFAMADARVPRLTWARTLIGAILLGRRLKKIWAGQRMVGILLPPSVGGALVNYAASFAGKVPVNLNYTSSDEIIASCAAQCGIEITITSRALLERVKLRVPGRVVFIEDVVTNQRASEKFCAALVAALPTFLIEKYLGRTHPASLDELATVIFSSGSTGDPKGVLLTHFNIAANLEQTLRIVHVTPDDKLLGILPFFHSFGFTVGLWLPAASGIGVVYHPNPVEARAISELVRTHGITLLVATPTFLQTYTRRCAREDFRSLRLVITGAEKLPRRLAEAFEQQFGLRPLEGYGCTECSPVVAANTGAFRAAGMPRAVEKAGKIGQPVPGMAARIVDLESGRLLAPGQAGMLHLRGPNIMQGYLGMPQKTAEVLLDGWYATADIAFLDEDGFIEITDRISRFSKIGGEMVPHLKVEDVLHEITGSSEQCFVVTGVPDERKGERLVVLHVADEETLRACIAGLAAAPLPNLWKPEPRQFFRVDALPYLGTGKLDLRRARELAARLSRAADEERERAARGQAAGRAMAN